MILYISVFFAGRKPRLNLRVSSRYPRNCQILFGGAGDSELFVPGVLNTTTVFPGRPDFQNSQDAEGPSGTQGKRP